MRSPVGKRRRLPGGHIALLACAAVLVCLYLIRRPSAAATSAESGPKFFKRLGHRVTAIHHSDLPGSGGSAAAAQYAVKSGVGGILFGEESVAVHEDTKDPERVFGHSGGAGGGADSKVRPLGFYFHKDIPKHMKHRGAGVPPGESSGSLEHLQHVAKHKASKSAAGDAELGFYFSKDIPDDVKAKPGDRRLAWLQRLPSWMRP